MASEIRVDKINSLSGVGTVTLSPTGVDIAGITTAATLRATTGIVTSLTAGSLTSLGAVSGTTGTFSGAVSGTTGTFSAAVSGTTGTFSAAVSGTTGTFSGAVSGTTGTFTGDVDIADKIIHTGDTNTAIRFPAADTITAETGGTERLRINSTGQTIVGDSVTQLTTSSERPFQVHSINGPKIAIGRNDTSISDGNTIGGIEFYGNDANGTFVNTASIIVDADGAHGDNDKPTRMLFYTTADGGSSATERLRIDSGGRVLMGGATSSHGSSNADDLQIGANNQGNQTGITLGSASASSIRFADASDDTAGQIYYSHSDNTMRFSAASSERVRIDTNGIKFNGDSAAANALDDYEEGTWTPTLQIQSGSFSTFSYQEQYGHYIKVGKLVTIFLRLRLGAVSGSGSGNVYIHSLPYVNHNIDNGAEGATFNINYYSAMGGLGNRVPVGYVQQNLSQIVIVAGGQGNGTASWNATNLNGTTGWQVYGAASYQTA